ncbi:MAG TPA: hypothetical protein VI056_12050 [Candidatus Limnocylindria bacterium]
MPARRDVPDHRYAFTLAMTVLAASGVALLAALWIFAQVFSAGQAG